MSSINDYNNKYGFFVNTIRTILVRFVLKCGGAK